MDVRLRSVIMLWLPLALLLWVGSGQAAKDKGPKVVRNPFPFRITDLQYFADSETVIAHSKHAGDIRISYNAGETWAKADGVPDESIFAVILHPYDSQRAYAYGPTERTWYTNDQGKTWGHFDIEPGMRPEAPPFSFHAGDPEKVLLNTQSDLCAGFLCIRRTYYTIDNFKNTKPLREATQGGCIFARALKEFKVRDEKDNNNLILCAVKENEQSLLPFNRERIVRSKDFFETEDEPMLDGSHTLKGAFEMAAIKGYLVVAQRSEGTSELALYVSDDAFQWDRAEFDINHKVEEGAYTVLESTDYSIQVLVKTLGNIEGMGTLLSSNSNGTYFRSNIEYVNRNQYGFVDFEKVQGIQGIYLVNTVSNWQEASTNLVRKKLRTRITFDDGRTFQDLHLLDEDGKKTNEKLHLHSVTGMSNSGRVFSSPAPGIVMGIGNTGDYLKEYQDGNMYVSDDGGLTWRLARKEAHKYEFGDQGSVLVAVFDEGATDEASYSLQHGQDWEDFKLESKMRADILTTVPDSTSLKFILTGVEGSGSAATAVLYFLDFEGLHERECGSGDFEEWVARKDEDGKPDCLMGHTQIYKRRKADAGCFVNHEFKKPEIKEDPCACTKEDFECGYNFQPDSQGTCQPTTALAPPEGSCKSDDADEKFKQSPFQLIPGNLCTKSGGVKLDEEEKEFECKLTKEPGGPASGKIETTPAEFNGLKFLQKVYLERGSTSTGDDETVLMLNEKYEVYKSSDQGKKWEQIKFGEPILGILPHPYNNDMVFFLTGSKRVYYSVNRMRTHSEFAVPAPPMRRDDMSPLTFHVKEDNWMIWIGEVDGHYNAFYSKDRGMEFHLFAQYTRKCEFIKRKEWEGHDELIFCEQHEGEDPAAPLQLVSSDDWFGSTPKQHFRDIVAFATMSDYIVVANKDADQHLKIDASIDGQTFADAHFPKDFKVPHDTAYTLLDSSTKAVFLQVTVSSYPGFEFGRLMKSNSNGTSYVSLIGAVNQNERGYVDFEKMQGIAGVAMVNVVDNYKEERPKEKLLKTLITHNDGANWALLDKVSDNLNEGFTCTPGNDCSLHLHSYTERSDPRKTFASASAIGLMMGVGNVGKYLEGDGDTFITRDGGLEWHRVKKGRYLWEYGDQGSIIVVIQERGSTDTLSYSLDEGRTWTDYQFFDKKMKVWDLTTIPSDKSHSFLVWGRHGDTDKLMSVNVDFDGLRGRKCKLEENASGKDDGDYYHWSPSHPEQDTDCLFGHKTVVHRKKPDADCWNDPSIDPLHSELTENCTCTRSDFEWYVTDHSFNSIH
jgi:Sortilin, neurotensin receptor 3,/Sortilin, neurotensin receptor 3, C-terminal